MATLARSMFHDTNSAKNVSENDQMQVSSYLHSIKAIAKLSTDVICVIDYINNKFEYVSENPLLLCGHTGKDVQSMGYDFYHKYVAEEDLPILFKAKQLSSEFYYKTPIKDRKDYSLSFDFHLVNAEGNKYLANQKCTPLFLNEDGKLWKSICHISLSSNSNAGNIKIFKKANQKFLEYNEETARWHCAKNFKLTYREKEILQLSLRGFCIDEIAQQLFVSANTVKFHRKKLFEKFEVTNIIEAISFAKSRYLI